MRRVSWIALALVMVLAIGLRFSRLQWGLDENQWFFDETMWAFYLQAFQHLSWNSFDTTLLLYPTFYRLVGGLGVWVAGLFGWSMTTVGTIAWMRALAASVSVLAVLVTARLGMAMYGAWAGIAAGALLAVAPFEVMQVHYASVEPILVLCITLVMASSWWLMRRGTVAAAALAGACVGLAASSKYPGMAFGSAVGWAIVERWWRDRSAAAALRLVAASGLGLVAGVALACPSCLLHGQALMEMLDRHRQLAAFAGFPGACLVPKGGWWHTPWLYEAVASLPYGMGLAFAVLGFAGVVAALWYHAPADRLLLATLVPYFAYMGASSVVYPRYMLPLFPGLALLGASALARGARPRLATVVAGLVVAYGLALSVSQLERFSWDQQAAVADWLGDRLPLLSPEDRLVEVPSGVRADPYYRLRGPIEAKGYKVELPRGGQWFAARPALFVMPDWLAMTIQRDRRNFLLMARLTALQNGVLSYRPVLRIPAPDYLQRSWDESWDPTFAVELWQGAVGFTVYARSGVLPDLSTVEVLQALPPRRASVESPDRR